MIIFDYTRIIWGDNKSFYGGIMNVYWERMRDYGERMQFSWSIMKHS